MISRIEIENFKAIGRKRTFEIRPITLLFGANSLGKSTVFDALKVLWDILPYRDTEADPVEEFAGRIHFGEEEARIAVTFKPWAIEALSQDPPLERSLSGPDARLEVRLVRDGGCAPIQLVMRLEIEGEAIQLTRKACETSGDFGLELTGSGYISSVLGQVGGGFDPGSWSGTPWLLASPNPKSHNVVDWYEMTVHNAYHGLESKVDLVHWLWIWLTGALHSYLASCLHLGPIRTHGWIQSDKWKASGIGERPWYFGYFGWYLLGSREELRAKVNHWLGSPAGIGSEYFFAVGDDENAQLRTRFHPEEVLSLGEVGEGITQVVPVLAALCAPMTKDGYAVDRPLVCVQQPELHLHPKAQLGIADLMIEGVTDRVVISETHSEHLLLRILRRLRESSSESSQTHGTIGPETIAIYFFERVEEQLLVSRLQLDEQGEPDGVWPADFFGERLAELI